MRENNKHLFLKEHDSLHTESWAQSWATREEILCVQSVRGAVCGSHLLVAYMGIAIAW